MALFPGFGDLVQWRTVPVRKDWTGNFSLPGFPGRRRYNYVMVDFRYCSQQVSYNGRSPHRIVATLGGGRRVAALTPSVLQIRPVRQRDSHGYWYYTEGVGRANVAFYAKDLPRGTYPLIFKVLDSSDRAIAQQIVNVRVSGSGTLVGSGSQ